jgi:hypothetical protein
LREAIPDFPLERLVLLTGDGMSMRGERRTHAQWPEQSWYWPGADLSARALDL